MKSIQGTVVKFFVRENNHITNRKLTQHLRLLQGFQNRRKNNMNILVF